MIYPIIPPNLFLTNTLLEREKTISKISEAKDKQKRLEERRLREQEESLAGKPLLIALGFRRIFGVYSSVSTQLQVCKCCFTTLGPNPAKFWG